MAGTSQDERKSYRMDQGLYMSRRQSECRSEQRFELRAESWILRLAHINCRREDPASGVFFIRIIGDPDARGSVSFDEISQGDGTGNTILYAEQSQFSNWMTNPGWDNPPWTLPLPRPQWFGADIREMAANPGGTNNLSLNLLNPLCEPYGDVNEINGKPTTTQPPVASSKHLGVIHVAFCDGRARRLNETMDRTVYLMLMTHDGQNYFQGTLPSY